MGLNTGGGRARSAERRPAASLRRHLSAGGSYVPAKRLEALSLEKRKRTGEASCGAGWEAKYSSTATAAVSSAASTDRPAMPKLPIGAARSATKLAARSAPASPPRTITAPQAPPRRFLLHAALEFVIPIKIALKQRSSLPTYSVAHLDWHPATSPHLSREHAIHRPLR